MKVMIEVLRFDPGKDKEPHSETYEIDHEEGMRLLHAFEHVQNWKDKSFSFRHNCGAGRCGSCAVEVNGKPVLACKYEIPKTGERISVRPLSVFPVVKDLVVDLGSIKNGLKKIKPFKPSQKPLFEMHDYEIELAKEMKKCIECGICQDSCHAIRDHKKDFIGPRFIAKIASLENHPYDSDDRSGDMEKLGIGYCNMTKCCQASCPENIRITTDAIIPMKEKAASQKRVKFIKKILGRGDE